MLHCPNRLGGMWWDLFHECLFVAHSADLVDQCSDNWFVIGPEHQTMSTALLDKVDDVFHDVIDDPLVAYHDHPTETLDIDCVQHTDDIVAVCLLCRRGLALDLRRSCAAEEHVVELHFGEAALSLRPPLVRILHGIAGDTS